MNPDETSHSAYPDASDIVHYLAIALYDGVAAEDTKDIRIYLYMNEETVNETVAEANAEGPGKWTWEYAEPDERRRMPRRPISCMWRTRTETPSKA